MKKIFTVIVLISFVFLLTGCTEKVEERTLTCIEDSTNEVLGTYVYQEKRLTSITIDGETITRKENLEDIMFFEEFIEEEYASKTLFEYFDDAIEELNEEDEGITCTLTSEDVVFEEDPESEGQTSQIVINTEKDGVLADSLAIENASKLYCAQTTCSADQQLTWTQLSPYVEGLDDTYYDFTNNSGIISTKVGGIWTIDLEVVGVGEWELMQDSNPSSCDRDCIIEDID